MRVELGFKKSFNLSKQERMDELIEKDYEKITVFIIFCGIVQLL